MCIFSGRVRSVADTQIFARLSGHGTQFVVYQMKYSSERPVAMILPLPVAEPAKRAGIRFINFKDYKDFFGDLNGGFPRTRPITVGMAMPAPAAAMARPRIHVESVGDFIASYVPTLNDFDRLDPRFRLPRSVWNQIPAYHDYGFAVFQLKETAAKGLLGGPRPFGEDEAQKVHPMAFEFHTRYAGTLYYPTVHIHDEKVHPEEEFDHALYLQAPNLRPDGSPARVSGPIAVDATSIDRSASSDDGKPVLWFHTSSGPAAGFVEWRKTQGVVDQSAACYRFFLRDTLPNKDTLVRLG